MRRHTLTEGLTELTERCRRSQAPAPDSVTVSSCTFHQFTPLLPIHNHLLFCLPIYSTPVWPSQIRRTPSHWAFALSLQPLLITGRVGWRGLLFSWKKSLHIYLFSFRIKNSILCLLLVTAPARERLGRLLKPYYITENLDDEINHQHVSTVPSPPGGVKLTHPRVLHCLFWQAQCSCPDDWS